MLVRLRESFVVGKGRLVLDVVIGEGQRGYVEVLLDGAVIAHGKQVSRLDVGDGPALAGKKLRVTSTVTDTNPNTNRTSVTYTITNGAQPKRFLSQHEVQSAGNTVDYDAIFLLV